MNKYAIKCDSLEDEKLLKEWIKTEFGSFYYQCHNFAKGTIFNFPNWKDGKGFLKSFHTGKVARYTEINIKDFLKEYNNTMKKELLGLPIIKGEKHHLEAFSKDCENLGYEMSTRCTEIVSGGIKLNTNTDYDALKEDGFKILFNKVDGLVYTGGVTLPIKHFNLPQDWAKALDFMEENMEVWKSLQEPEFKVGDYIVFDGTHHKSPVYKLLTYNSVNNFGTSAAGNHSLSNKEYRKATPEEIQEYLNKPKIFKMTSSSGDFELEVSKKGIYYRPENSWLSIDDIEVMLRSSLGDNITINQKVGVVYFYKFTTVDVGCMKMCKVSEWKEVYDYYKSITQ